MTTLLVLTSSCGFFRSDRPAVEGEATMQPTSLTVTEAARTVSGFVSMIVDKPIDPDPAHADKLGCRTDDAFMPAGPPWRVRRNAWIVDPPQELVAAALSRIETLREQGFEPVPWTRPEPEPPNDKAYRDSRGYIVSVKAGTNAAGIYALDVSATSPCAEED
ncbi:hypothetical protein [Mycobacterium sp. GA-1841]|uniref:hypothetical protein n=1 Tax=Mycobacterium sp. GA-1841 TaxID=1834154 RepID=UPI0020C967D5|nr:hypothetical protein [Mycobacterium sp. GA-1841]